MIHIKDLTLKGLSYIYRGALELWYFYDGLRDKKIMPSYTISVGNLTVGGTGKTPLVLLIAGKLSHEYRVAILSRGYRRKSKGTLVLSRQGVRFTWKETGDEPYLLWRKTGGKIPIIITKDRWEAAHLATRMFRTQVFVLDDGFQYLKIQKDKEILLFDWKTLRMGDALLPYGRLREPWKAVKRADIIVINFKEVSFDEYVVEKVRRWGKPYFFMRYVPVGLYDLHGRKLEPHFLQDREVAIFSAVGDNESFENMVKKLGARIVAKVTARDHSVIGRDILRKLQNKAEYIITTEKDIVKYPGVKNLYALEIKPELNNEREFFKLIWPNF